jgi:hypothetical protein
VHYVSALPKIKRKLTYNFPKSKEYHSVYSFLYGSAKYILRSNLRMNMSSDLFGERHRYSQNAKFWKCFLKT